MTLDEIPLSERGALFAAMDDLVRAVRHFQFIAIWAAAEFPEDQECAAIASLGDAVPVVRADGTDVVFIDPETGQLRYRLSLEAFTRMTDMIAGISHVLLWIGQGQEL